MNTVKLIDVLTKKEFKTIQMSTISRQGDYFPTEEVTRDIDFTYNGNGTKREGWSFVVDSVFLSPSTGVTEVYVRQTVIGHNVREGNKKSENEKGVWYRDVT